MEKVAGNICQRLRELLPPGQKIGLLVGPGHNGADTLVVARELWQKGYFLIIHHPFRSAKELTLAHKTYAHYLGIPEVENVQELSTCDVLIDERVRSEMPKILTEIQTGQFAREFVLENQAGKPGFTAMRRREAEHPIEEVGRDLRAMFSWLKTD